MEKYCYLWGQSKQGAGDLALFVTLLEQDQVQTEIIKIEEKLSLMYENKSKYMWQSSKYNLIECYLINVKISYDPRSHCIRPEKRQKKETTYQLARLRSCVQAACTQGVYGLTPSV